MSRYYGIEAPYHETKLSQVQQATGGIHLLIDWYLCLVVVGLSGVLALQGPLRTAIWDVMLVSLSLLVIIRLVIKIQVRRLGFDRLIINRHDYVASKARLMRQIYWRSLRMGIAGGVGYVLSSMFLARRYDWMALWQIPQMYVGLVVMSGTMALATYVQYTGKLARSAD